MSSAVTSSRSIALVGRACSASSSSLLELRDDAVGELARPGEVAAAAWRLLELDPRLRRAAP